MSALTISKEDEKRVKGMGFLNNRGTDLFSARVLTVNGKVTAAQHHCMADAAEKFGNGNLLYTTRLSVEIQGIPYDKIEEFQEFIAKEGLVTGGTGAKVRPVVSCKGTTCQYGLLDSYALSEEIYRRFYEGFQDVALPHKFKFIYSILYKPCIFKAYRLLNVQTLCIFPCFCPYEPKQGKFLFSADYLIQQSCGSTLRFPCSVSVNVHCGTDISVSEKFLHIFRCCTV